jgi:hypothetical protein
MTRAISSGGASYELKTHGEAINWRMRAYQFRRMFQKAAQERENRPGFFPTTAYDPLMMQIEGKIVYITFREMVQGKLSPLPEGRARPALPQDDLTDEELLQAAERLLAGDE